MATKKPAKVIPISPVKSWSFSRYSDYRLCPAKFKYKHLDKLQEPKNPAMERGDLIHKLAEKFIKGMLPAKLPPELKLFGPEFKELRAMFKKISQSMVVEDSWATTKDWGETTWNDWANCWLRLKVDCAFHDDDVTLRIVDWKTGKFRPEKNEEYVEQLELYALVALLFHEHIQRVIPELAYLDEGSTYPSGSTDEAALVFTRDDIPRLKQLWERRVGPMFRDTIFAPRPNNLCRFCHYRAENHGPCQY